MKKALAWLLTFTMIFASFGTSALAANNPAAPTPDILNVDFQNGTADDLTGKHTANKQGAPIIEAEESLNGQNAATFDGSSSYFYDMAASDYTAMQNTFTVECMFKYNELSTSGEIDVFSNQQSGGAGIGVYNKKLTLFVNVDGDWKQPTYHNISAGVWYHVAGVYDGSAVKLYVNGELISSIAATGKVKAPSSAAQFFVIGGDSNNNHAVQFNSKSTVNFARIYSQALTADEVVGLSKEAAEEANPTLPTADLLDVDFENGTADDLTAKHAARAQGTPAIVKNPGLGGKKTATFDGTNSYSYDFTADDYAAMKNSVALECMFQLHEIPSSGEKDVFSNQQSGGLGLGVYKGKLTLFVNVDGSSKEPKADIETDTWYHVVGVFDGSTVKLYVNGSLISSVDAAGAIKNPSSSAQFFVIGGDSNANKAVQFNSKSTVDFARIYGTALSEKEIANLARKALSTVAPELPTADLLNVDFADGTPADTAANRPPRTQGSPVIGSPTELKGQNAATFNGSSSYSYDMTAADYTAMQNTLTMECMFKYNELPTGGEIDVFSNQQSGGAGIGVYNGKLTLFVNVNGSWKQPTYNIGAGVWYHVVGVYDGSAVKLYVNGELVSSLGATGKVKAPSSSAQFYVIGGDSNNNQAVQFNSKSTVNFARLYSQALTAKEVAALSDKVFAETDVPKNPPQKINVGFVASNILSSDSEANFNLHLNSNLGGKVDKVTFEVKYDTDLLKYENLQHLQSGVTVQESTPGTLLVTHEGDISTAAFRQFSSTRLAKLNFTVKHAGDSTESSMEIKNIRLFASGKAPENGSSAQGTDKAFTILPQEKLDLNKDGFVGAGDIPLTADENFREAIAQASVIRPYKHVIVLTMDGAGVVWDPDSMYYASSNSVIPTKTSDPDIMALRTNTYAMDLMNKQFATSYTASAVNPPISAQNYSAILHGVPWKDVESAYQVTNDSAGNQYYADFGKETALHPSIFKVLSNQLPGRPLAAYAEWAAIPNGIIEPDIPVIGRVSSANRSFYDVADYIKGDYFGNTPLVYMQSDVMDHIGHGTGYYNKTYWKGLQPFDDYLKAVMDALKESGHTNDTLVISNADHGGSGTSHGDPNKPSHMNIFIAMGGQTIDNGKRLNGGSNADIPALVLNALRLEKPTEMSKSKVFDSSAFLAQEEMAKKNRDVEKVVFRTSGNKASLTLENKKSETRAVDLVIDLNGGTVKDVQTSGTILRQTAANDQLRLTISYSSQPEQLAVLTFEGDAAAVKANEVMLGAGDGAETYCDLENTVSDPTELQQAINAAQDAVDSRKYQNDANLQALKAEITAAQALLDNAASSTEYGAMIAKLSSDMAKLVKLDDSVLRQEIANAEKLLMNNYLDGLEKENFLSKLEAAKDLLKTVENGTALQQEIDDAIAALKEAKAKLAVKPEKTALKGLLDRANGIKLSGYTDESADALKAAIADASTVYGNPQASAQQVAQAEEALQTAMDGLKAVEEKPDDVKTGRGGEELSIAITAIAALGVLVLTKRKKRK